MRLAAALGTAWIVGYALASVLTAGDPGAQKALGQGLYLVPTLVAVGIALLARRAASGSQRWVWTALAASAALWLAADLTFYYGYAERPYPSVADALYLGSTALGALALPAALARLRWRDIWRVLLDGSIVAVATAYLGVVLLIAPQLESGGDDTLTMTVSVAYPALNIVILVVLATVGLAARGRASAAGLIVGIGYLVAALSNALYTRMALSGDFAAGSLIDVGWETWAVMLCVAGTVATRRPTAPRREGGDSGSGIVAIVIGVGMAVGIFASDLAGSGGKIGGAAAAVCLYTLLAVLWRLVSTLRERQRLASTLRLALEKQEELATTDWLTGLHNRRFLDDLMSVECARARRQDEVMGLLSIDIDHFKHVNDRFGHPVGDLVLREVARRLRQVVREGDVLARAGGEEFAVLVHGAAAEALPDLGERLRRTIASPHFKVPGGYELAVTASIGACGLRGPRCVAEELMVTADRALYAAKALGRNQVQVGVSLSSSRLQGISGRGQIIEFLQGLADAAEERGECDEHGQAMARWVTEVAGELRLPDEVGSRCALAARLHDVGKIGIPPHILSKPGPLTDEEWAMMHRHPEIGARILSSSPEVAPIAGIVASHHERWDGAGYPARLAGDEIPVEARIIAVCEAWAAMRADRPYRAALTPEAARRELRRGANTQFDPAVVDAFLRVESSGGLELEHGGTMLGAARASIAR